ncbi:MAG: 2-succinyl-5-enolpyruvyl-6-hydroxy-3-cyclohexene-1-carboxylic-acid synthase [Myxococcales bacterium]|nr:MAG: 2-succinyl-5-enolpyruvyl-6-hydroxy-3-cyclohexene-1-carboxylic-acid synthase [Myxococcales bacterium]
MSASRSSEVDAVSDAYLIGEWSRLVFATLLQAGVTDVWVSPGSRSTPFTLAAARTAGITLRPVVDERSAAFMALGYARITGRPGAVLCTSGSAAANYFPAVVEASQASLPLLVLTADRPLDVQQAQAAQTIDQLKLYGGFARSFFDLGLPESSPAALIGARRALAQAAATARGPLPGPVHVNLRARKPLEPRAAQTEAERGLGARVTRLLETPLLRYAPEQALANEAVLAATRTLQSAGSGLIVVGPVSAANESLAQPLAQLAELTGFPVYAEAPSQVRFALSEHALSVPLLDWLLSTPALAESLKPDVLVCIGSTPTSSAYERWAERVPTRVVFAEHGYPDAVGGAELVASGDLSRGLSALCQELARRASAREPSSFAVRLREAHDGCVRRIDELLAEPTRELVEGAVVKAVVESLPTDAVLALGNSLPIREVDAYVTRAPRFRVVCQRGANGIDGLVSGALGSALASGAPTLLLLGDVSLLHDVGALASARLVTSPLVIAVVDNAGGRIFDQLPVQKVYAADAALTELWLTPPNHELSHAAALFGLTYEAPTSLEAVRAVTRAALARGGPTLLHLRVGPNSAAEQRRRVLGALAAQVTPGG